MKMRSKSSVYIGLGIFLAGIVATGMITNHALNKTNKLAQNVSDEQERQAVSEIVYIAENEKEESLPAVDIGASSENTKPIDTESDEVQPTEEAFELAAPVMGEILTPFSGGQLVFSNTMQDYRAHKGIDIKAAELEKVLAAEAGLVKDIRTDSALGITIIIDHGNGFETVYGNLSTRDMVKVGDRVKKGAILSGVGNTAAAETEDGYHLHFELIKDGKQTDPADYIAF